MGIEQFLVRFYAVLIQLYPNSFRRDFEEEMCLVFGDALANAHRNGPWAVLRLCSCELSDLPGAVMREHWQTGRDKEPHMNKDMGMIANQMDSGMHLRSKRSIVSWGDILLAVLPFLLILLADTLPRILVETHLLSWDSTIMRIVTFATSSLLIIALLFIVTLGWRQKWPLWSASWFLYYVLISVGLASWLIGVIFQIDQVMILQPIILYQIFPLAIAVLLYAETRHDRARSLLAALPVLYLLWQPNMEFVADPIEIAIKVISTALICWAIVFLMNRQDRRDGFYAVLAVNLVVGFLFSYAGTYHGGTLPFTAPGPSLVEVLRSMLPQFLAISAILVGALFAWKFRQVGMDRGRAARVAYHLALAGLLLIIMGNLGGLMMGMDPPSITRPSFSNKFLEWEIILGIGIYILGLIMLHWGTLKAKGARFWFERLLLVVLPLALPIVMVLPFFSWRRPMSAYYGIPSLWQISHDLIYLFGTVWFVLSIWLVTRSPEYSLPQTSLVEAAEVPQPS